MTIISIFMIGFSIIIALTLLISYFFFIRHPHKAWISLCSSAGLLGGLALAQYGHYQFYAGDIDPLSTVSYRMVILFIPSMFYFFSRAILFPERKTKALQLLHLAPWLLALFAPREVTVPIAFVLGAVYSLWLTNIVYSLRSVRSRFGLVFGFCAVFSVLSVVVLILGFTATYVELAYFYHFYTNGIGVSLVLVTISLVVFPNLLGEIDEVVRLGYSNSTLSNLDIESCKSKLAQLMAESKIYQNEDLSLAVLAEQMEISSHQLSELINTQFKLGFSQYIRQQRIDAAKHLLVTQASASILSISMEVGFRTQSNFYAAFKEITGESPGSFRKTASV